MKSLLSYRTSLLIGCAAFTLLTANAYATDVNSPAPSVEIHLEALNNLGHYQPVKTASATDDSATSAPKALKKHGKKSHAHAAAPKAAPTETAADASKADTAAKDTSSEPPSLDSASGAKSAAAEPPPLSAAAKLPETAASGTDIPKLSPTELVRTEPAAPATGKKDGALSGLSDLLGGDAKKPAEPAKPAAAQATQSLPPVAEVIAPATPTKDLPPPLSATAPAAAPAVADNAPPPLEAAKNSKAAEKDADKMILASNEPPSMPDVAAKSEVPPLTPSQATPKEMAQSTLTPLPSNPAAPAAAPVTAPTPAAAAPATATAPLTASAPAAASPAPDAAPAGAAPDLRIPFNESETEMPLSASAQLDAIAKTLHDSPNSRINIVGYANGPQTTGIYPKRVSLARGIAVRNYLTTTKGIDIERVNVKAMGNKNAGGPGDRVDIYIVK